MAGFISSVNLIAGAGILGGIGGTPISANSATITNISSYGNLAVISQYANIRATGNVVLSSNVMPLLNNLAGNIFPAVTDAVPSSYVSSLGSTPIDGFTSLVTTEINNIMGSGDLGKFEQVLGAAEALVVSTNQLINSMVNANDSSSNATYSTQDNTLTGGLSQVTQAFEAFGSDLTALGLAINLDDLPNLGSPQSLLRQIYNQTSGSAELNSALVNAGIDQNTIETIDAVTMTDEQQRIAYNVMSKITGPALTQILKLLRVSTTGISNMSELLNPVKLFPQSFNTLTAPTVNGLRGIYINSSGAVNTNLETELPPNVLLPLQGYQTEGITYNRLSKIIPSDWALANKALQAGLQQVKSIFNSTTSFVGTASLGLESNKGLNLINALTDPLPTSVTNFYKQSYSSGSGPNGTLLLADVIGSAAGWVVNDNISSTTSTLTSLTTSGALSTLTSGSTGVFTVMQNVIDGVYGDIANSITIPGGLPGAGTYSDGNIAFTGPGTPGVGLMPAAYSLIANIIAANGSAVANTNSNWANVAAQLVLENTNLVRAGVIFSELQPGFVPNNLVSSLPQYGLDTTEGGAAWFMESVANVSTIGGQAIISTMREARNQVRLQNAGIETDIIVSDIVPQPQATLSSGQYTVSEAVAQKVITGGAPPPTYTVTLPYAVNRLLNANLTRSAPSRTSNTSSQASSNTGIYTDIVDSSRIITTIAPGSIQLAPGAIRKTNR